MEEKTVGLSDRIIKATMRMKTGEIKSCEYYER